MSCCKDTHPGNPHEKYNIRVFYICIVAWIAFIALIALYKSYNNKMPSYVPHADNHTLTNITNTTRYLRF